MLDLYQPRYHSNPDTSYKLIKQILFGVDLDVVYVKGAYTCYSRQFYDGFYPHGLQSFYKEQATNGARSYDHDFDR